MVKACFNIKRIIAVLPVIVVLLTAGFAVSSDAFALRTEKEFAVGANASFGLSKVNAGYTGYASDYFERFSRFSGNMYTYKEGTPEELFDMLFRGEIDVIPCVTAGEIDTYCSDINISEENSVRIVSFPLFAKFSAVYVYDNGKNKDTNLNDTDAIRAMKIGYLSDDEKNYFKDGRFVQSEIEEAEFVRFNDEKELYSAFVSGEVDAVVKNCLRTFADETIVYRFGIEECYFAARADETETISALSQCMEQVVISYPNFAGEVYEKYISDNGAQKYAYTESERRYLGTLSDLTVAFNMDSDLLNVYNSSADNLGGAAGEVFGKLSEITGLEINILPCGSMKDCVNALENGKAELIFGDVPADGLSDYPDYLISSPVVRAPVVIVGREGTTLGDSPKIASFSNGEEFVAYLETVFTSPRVKHYASAEECFEALRGVGVDAVCMGLYDFLYLRNNGYEDYTILDVCPVYHSDCFAIKSGNQNLMGIIEKTLSRINSTAVMADAYNAANTDTSSREDQSYIIMLIVTGLTALAVIVVGFLIMTSLRNRRKSEVDNLTGGRTRDKFVADCSRLIRKTSAEKWALVVLDIDKFKYINDRLGYEEGNKMLARVHRTLQDNAEGDEICARISNDNFAMMIKNVPDNEIVNRLNNIFSEFERRNALYVKYPVVFSSGVCRLGQCEGKFGVVDINIAIDRCIIAKKTIKSLHGNSIAFYDGKIRENILREKDIENAMPSALENREFMCYLQPKYGTKSRHIEGAEALIRWNSKEYGFVFPDQFIPVAEKNGFVVELDFFILEEVCRTMRNWLDRGLTPVVISVNQSRMHLNNDDYIWRLREIVDKYEIPYEYLELELTESVFTEDTDRMLKIMKKLHDIGFKISIDDFGSGYSSLNMLKDIPADVVKIDREFFNGTVNSEKGRAVISTVVDLAKNLNMDVISEGVETQEQVEFLQEIDCHLVQGYYFAKPMPVADFEKIWLKELDEQTYADTSEAFSIDVGEDTENDKGNNVEEENKMTDEENTVSAE